MVLKDYAHYPGLYRQKYSFSSGSPETGPFLSWHPESVFMRAPWAVSKGGLNLPSAAVLYQLSMVLNVPVDALFATEVGHGPVATPTCVMPAL